MTRYFEKQVKTVGELVECLSTLNPDLPITATWEGQDESIQVLVDNQKQVILFVEGYDITHGDVDWNLATYFNYEPKPLYTE